MIICPNCLHQNADNIANCEACQAELPATSSCPKCGASMQLGAQFCGQCGFNLTEEHSELDEIIALTADSSEPDPALSSVDNPFVFPEPQPPDPLVMPDLMSSAPMAGDPPEAIGSLPSESELPDVPLMADERLAQDSPDAIPPIYPGPSNAGNPETQLQQQTVQLVHIQTNTVLDLPLHLNLIRIGKPNNRVPPDIDVSGFPNAEVVSRSHIDIRVEGGHYFIEDVGSSNGTYINNIPLLPGTRHRLRPGDRIALGKGNLVTFLFQLN